MYILLFILKGDLIELNVLSGLSASVFKLAIKYPWLGAMLGVGEGAINWGNTIIGGVRNVLMVLGGGVLIIFGGKGFIKAWIPDNKDIKGIIISIVTIIVGFACAIGGGAGLAHLAQVVGSDWNIF
ncbi:hypothetical protein ACWCL1_08115 [Ligilactobacillus sp. LYQ135]